MTPHLRGNVRAYVDRAMPPAILHVYDRHLVCCAVCRGEADQERRIVAALRADTTGVPMGLRSALIGLASQPPADAAPVRTVPGVPRVPLPPVGFRLPNPSSHAPVPTVAPSAPALHRSPVRAAVVASLAAGASVAAAWGLAISPIPGSRTPASARVPVGVSSFGSSAFGASTASVTLPSSRLAAGGTSSTGFGSAVPAPYWVVSARTHGRMVDVGSVRVSMVASAQSAP